jgi:ABC-type amino acid transport system permease subunit
VGPFFLALVLLILLRIVLGTPVYFQYQAWAYVLAPLFLLGVFLNACRLRTHLFSDEKERRLWIAAPVFGQTVLNLDDFRGAWLTETSPPYWVRMALSLLLAGLFLVFGLYNLPAGGTVSLVIHLVMALSCLGYAYQVHTLRGGQRLILRFDGQTGWQRHLLQEVTFALDGNQKALAAWQRRLETGE